MNSNELSQADFDLVCEAQWNADPSVPTEDRFQEVYEDEDEHLGHTETARECAMSRDFNHFASPASLQADYDKHGNAWPFSGDHLGTQHVRDEYHVPGYGWESGDVIGRVRVRTATGVLWSRVAVG